MHYCFFFFFSSRRRHTRWPRDWSSDVCSSDLADPGPGQAGRGGARDPGAGDGRGHRRRGAVGLQDDGRGPGQGELGGVRVLPAGRAGGTVRGRVAPDRRRGGGGRARVPAAGGPDQGPGEVRRRVDLDDRAGVGADGASGGAGGGGDRGPRRTVERTAPGLRGPEAGGRGHAGGAHRVHRAAVRQVVAARAHGVRERDPEDERREVRQEGPPGAAPGNVRGLRTESGGDVAVGVTALERWAAQLEAWALPEEILARAPESPWGFPVE